MECSVEGCSQDVFSEMDPKVFSETPSELSQEPVKIENSSQVSLLAEDLRGKRLPGKRLPRKSLAGKSLAGKSLAGTWEWALREMIRVHAGSTKEYPTSRYYSPQLLHRALRRFQRLGELLALFNQKHPLKVWVQLLSNRFKQHRSIEQWSALLHIAIDEIQSESSTPDLQEDERSFARYSLTFEEFWEFAQVICRDAAQKTGQGYPEALKFASITPMRSIPAKYIGIMGMDDLSFPRADHHDRDTLFSSGVLAASLGVEDSVERASSAMSGSLSQAPPPTLGQFDRYSFLEAILCCQEQLFITYTPCDGARGMAQPVEDLCRYILQNITDAHQSKIDQSQSRREHSVERSDQVALSPPPPAEDAITDRSCFAGLAISPESYLGLHDLTTLKQRVSAFEGNWLLNDLENFSRRPIHGFLQRVLKFKIPSSYAREYSLKDESHQLRARSQSWIARIESSLRMDQEDKRSAYSDLGLTGPLKQVGEVRVGKALWHRQSISHRANLIPSKYSRIHFNLAHTMFGSGQVCEDSSFKDKALGHCNEQVSCDASLSGVREEVRSAIEVTFHPSFIKRWVETLISIPKEIFDGDCFMHHLPMSHFLANISDASKASSEKNSDQMGFTGKLSREDSDPLTYSIETLTSIFPRLVTIEGRISSTLFERSQLPIKNFDQLIQWWPSLLSYTHLTGNKRCYEALDPSTKEQLFVIDMREIDAMEAWREWLGWMITAHVIPCFYRTGWMDLFRRGRALTLAGHYGDMIHPQSRHAAINPALRALLVTLGRNRFEGYLHYWQARYHGDFASLEKVYSKSQ